MPPSKSLLCPVEGCDSVFTKVSELRKHEVSHANPEKIFKCAECDFTTIQKKNLTIHTARHTGEKRLQCPHTIICLDSDSDSPSHSSAIEQRCDFRTSDPAALTRHRKVHHGYAPTRRGRIPNHLSVPALPHATVALPNPVQAVDAIPRRVTFLVHGGVDDSANDSGYSSPEPPHSPITLTWTGGVDAYRGESSATDSSDTDAPRPPTSRFRTWSSRDYAIAPYQHIGPFIGLAWEGLHAEDDNESYMVEVERLRPALEMELHEEDIFNLKTGREGCLCPKWMVEAGIEGWDASVLELHKDYYMPLAGSSSA